MGVGILLLIGMGGWWLLGQNQSRTPLSPIGQETTKETPGKKDGKYQFGNPKKSAHYESNTPAHGAVLAGRPLNIVIDFNFDLAKPSEIKIQPRCEAGENCQEVEYGEGETVIDKNKLAMRQKVVESIPDGIYTVNYNACWPDGSCHDGNFEFAIDRTLAENYADFRGQKEVKISMKEIKFLPEKIRVDSGTKVTWTNDDMVDHYVNTDSHPAHTYFPEQNSKLLAKGQTHTVTFNTPGIYPYHCSAHTIMTGSVLVE